jgi:hypothetical protein
MRRVLREKLTPLREMAKINSGNKDVYGYNLYANYEPNHPNYAHIHALKGDKREIVFDFKGNLIHNSCSESDQTVTAIGKWIQTNHNLIITTWRKDVLAQNPDGKRH